MHTSKLYKFVSVFNLSDLIPFRCQGRNNSYPNNNSSNLTQNLSRSVGNIIESNYDTVYSTDSFVIAKGISNDNLEYDNDLVENDTEKLLSE